jgi:hypothetical protein
MSRRRTLRRSAHWACATATIFVAAAYLWSAWCYARWEDTAKGSTVILHRGGVHIWLKNTGFSYTGLRPSFCWGPRRELRGFTPPWAWLPAINTTSANGAIIPLWAPLLIPLVPALLLWRAEARDRRRARKGFCFTCAYDCSGLPPETACPECGTTR